MDDRARHQEGAAQVDLHHAVPVLVLHADEQRVARHARVVDEDVEPAELLPGRVHEPLGVLALAASATTPSTRRRATSRFLHRRLAAGRRRDPRLPRPLRARPASAAIGGADAAATAGHDGHLAVERPSSRASCRGQRRRGHLSRPAGSSTESARASGTMRLTQARQDAAGPDLHEGGGALGGEPLHARPSSGRGWRPGGAGTAARRPPSGSRRRRRCGRPAAWARRSGAAARSRREPLAGRRHERAVEGRAHRQHHALRGRPAPWPAPPRAPPRVRWPAITICIVGVHVRDLDDLALGGVGADALHDVGSFEAHDGGHRAGPHGNGLLHELAAPAHDPHRVGEVAARRRPPGRSTRRGCARPPAPGRRPRSAHAAAAATLAVSTAGCVLAVSARSASGPLEDRGA